MDGKSVFASVGGIVAAIVGINAAAERNAAGEITTAGTLDAFEVSVGDCFNDEAFENTEISELPAVPCSEPHDNEIYALFDITGEWPGEERVAELADEGCLSRFAGAIGKSYEDSEIALTTMYPTEGSWKQRNDREVVCVAFHMEYEQLTGTVRGSRR
jgi:hypothetical protein